MKVIIAGPRDHTQDQTIYFLLETQYEWRSITEVVSGRARGVDTAGEVWAGFRGIPVKPFPANWNAYPKGEQYKAGPIRNKQMADYADSLCLLWDGTSRGSLSMLNIAKQFGLPRVVFQFNRCVFY